MKATLIKANDMFLRIHTVFMEIIRLELERLGVYDLTSTQYMILDHLGHDRIPVGDLSLRISYFGTNISYNVRKMVESGYIIQEKAQHDHRTHYVFISPQSKGLIEKMNKSLEDHGDMLNKYGITKNDIGEILSSIGKIDDFWTYTLSHRYRGG
jgi:DNA-binding MarR family transcriptional regulator